MSTIRAPSKSESSLILVGPLMKTQCLRHLVEPLECWESLTIAKPCLERLRSHMAFGASNESLEPLDTPSHEQLVGLLVNARNP